MEFRGAWEKPEGRPGGIDSPPGPPRQREKMASLAVPNSAANIHLEDGRTPESLSCAGFVPFLGHFVAIRM